MIPDWNHRGENPCPSSYLLSLPFTQTRKWPKTEALRNSNKRFDLTAVVKHFAPVHHKILVHYWGVTDIKPGEPKKHTVSSCWGTVWRLMAKISPAVRLGGVTRSALKVVSGKGGKLR